MQENTKYRRPDEAELKSSLDELQYAVLVFGETEAPHTSPHLQNKDEGIYVDVATGEPLFTTYDQFDSSCGWPSFTRPIKEKHITTKEDRSHGMCRTEVRSCGGDFHLGHVFEDGPEDEGGLRYCINGAAIRFVPIEDMEIEGYSYLLPYLHERKQQCKKHK
ncbi:peptide-methionine (R)-S-oxide reductase MsrB [Christensenellaceae bacterium OttesenSCG-928-K19]|nr:peptide-methionine (R)-S-oxide reductase MsrB [Christensenellaceae bacterium OttesenSCG-928-K19]